jgi:hypothetical protein
VERVEAEAIYEAGREFCVEVLLRFAQLEQEVKALGADTRVPQLMDTRFCLKPLGCGAYRRGAGCEACVTPSGCAGVVRRVRAR